MLKNKATRKSRKVRKKRQVKAEKCKLFCLAYRQQLRDQPAKELAATRAAREKRRLKILSIRNSSPTSVKEPFMIGGKGKTDEK